MCLEFLRIYGLFVAGAEGIEPSAYGFGDLHGRTRNRLITGHNSCIFFGSRCIKMFGEQLLISMRVLNHAQPHIFDTVQILLLAI